MVLAWTPSATPPTREQVRAMMAATVAGQFETIGAAAEGCDVIVGATALQIATPSIAEQHGVPYVFAAYCPAVIPSPKHAPPVLPMLGDEPAPRADDYSALWERDAARWNAQWREILDEQRAARGLSPVPQVHRHILTARPWLAADPALAPWPEPDDPGVQQTGAWILEGDRPLPDEVEAFLAAGEAPVFFGFGSNRAPDGVDRTMLAAARAVGRRAIVSRGWSELTPEEADDVLSVGEVDYGRLLPRCAVVVHHGGAGTTTAAARAGTPQVIIPQHYDQYWFAQRIADLSIGAAHPPGSPAVDSLTAALTEASRPEVAARARELAGQVRTDGARIAADHVLELAAR